MTAQDTLQYTVYLSTLCKLLYFPSKNGETWQGYIFQNFCSFCIWSYQQGVLLQFCVWANSCRVSYFRFVFGLPNQQGVLLLFRTWTYQQVVLLQFCVWTNSSRVSYFRFVFGPISRVSYTLILYLDLSAGCFTLVLPNSKIA